MTQKKPDRWERMVNDCHFNDRADAADAVTLLRKEHRAVVDLINKDIRRCNKIVAETDVVSDVHMQAIGEWRVLRELLAELKKRIT